MQNILGFDSLDQNLLHCTSRDAKSLGFHWPRWVWFMNDPSLDRRIFAKLAGVFPIQDEAQNEA
jgi:hypothetical protein